MRLQSRLLLPLLAVAALVVFPMIAQAESSSETVYKTPLHNIESTGPEKGGKSATPNEGRPKAPNPGDQGEPATTTSERTPVETTAETETERGSKPGHKHRTGPPDKGGDHHPGGSGTGPGESEPPNGSHGSESDGTQLLKSGASGIGGGGGSSPWLPILIAVGILAAISIGFVIYRERRPAG
jgi:hypothetical protein